jgi:surface protein
MLEMFSNANSFNQPIGSWDVSSVTNMYRMFYSADSFNQNIGAWNVEKVNNMSGMFAYTPFNNSGSADINNWRPISCSNFNSMFYGAQAFNQPIENWPLSASNIDMSSMFGTAGSFDQNIGSWDVSNVTNMSRMFYSASSFNQDLNSWDVSKVTNFTEIFEMATSFNGDVSSWNITSGSSLFRTFKTATSFDQDISGWDTSNITNIQEMFNDAVIFNQPIGNWDVSKVTNMQTMFRNAYAFNQDIGNWNVSNVTSFNGYFGGFMQGKSAANYSYLHTIYDGWINNKLRADAVKYGGYTISFGSVKYTASAAEGKALMTRTYNTASIIGSNDDLGQLAITCSANHNVIAGNKIFISGSSYPGINGVQVVHATGSATTLTLAGVPYDPLAIDGEVTTGYGWSITDGGPV